MRLPLLGDTQEHPSIISNNQKTINWYPVPSKGGISPFSLICSPGSVQLASVTAGESRGFIKVGDLPYAVVGTSLYCFDENIQVSNLGTIAGSGRVGMAHDGTNLVIVTGVGNPGYVFDGSTLSTITDPDFPGADDVTFLYGFFVASSFNDDQIYVSDLNSPTSWPAASSFFDEKPDKLKRIIVDHGEIFAFGTEGTEVWYFSGDLSFPFERNQSAIIDRGTKATWSVRRDDNTVFFLGDDLIVYRMEGYNPVRISDESVETALSSYTKINLENSYAFTYTDHGHKFYQLTIPNHETWVYDIATGQWHNRKHFDLKIHHAFDYVWAYGKHIILDNRDNGLFLEWSRSIYDDNGTTLKSERKSQYISNSDQRIRWKRLKIVMETGVGLPTGQGSDPIITMRISDDRGRTFKNEKQLKIGQAGRYKKQVIKRHLGSSRVRQYELSISDPVPRNIADVYAVVE